MPEDDERARIEGLEIEIETLKVELSQAHAKIGNLIQAIELLNRQLADARGWIAEYGKGD